MKKQKFSFADPDFSESSSDAQQYLPTSSLRQYNKQYSFIIAKVEEFFRECKICIERFVALNQFGVGLNLNHLLSIFSKMQRNIVSNKCSIIYRCCYYVTHTSISSNTSKMVIWKRVSNKNQNNNTNYRFIKYLDKCKSVLRTYCSMKVVLKCNILVKLNVGIQQYHLKSTNRQLEQYKINQKIRAIKKVRQNLLLPFLLCVNMNEGKIRQILTQKLNPQKVQSSTILDCQKDYDENIVTLDTKINEMIENISNMKQKQQKIIQIFNDNRFENTLEARKSKLDSNYKLKKEEIISKARMMIKKDQFDYPTAANSQYQYPQ